MLACGLIVHTDVCSVQKCEADQTIQNVPSCPGEISFPFCNLIL